MRTSKMNTPQLPSDYLSEGWCRRNMAENEHGQEIPYFGETACSVCILGAIFRSMDRRVMTARTPEAMQMFIAEEIGVSIPQWQADPRRKKSQVISVVRKAERHLGIRKTRAIAL